MPVSADIYRNAITPLEQQQLVYRNQLAQLVVQQQQRQAQQQNALRQLYANPQFNPASPSPDALRQVGAIDPAAAQDMLANQQRTQLYQAELARTLTMARHYDAQAAAERQSELRLAIVPAKQAALTAYQDALRRTGDPAAAQKTAQDAYAAALQDLNDGSIPPDTLRALQGQRFDPGLFRAQVFGAKPPAAPATRMFPTSDTQEQQQQWDPASATWQPVGQPVARFASQLPPSAAPGGAELSDQAFDLAANTYLQTGQLPPLGMGRSGMAIRTGIINRAAELAKERDKSPEDAATQMSVGRATRTAYTQASRLYNFTTGFERTAQGSIGIVTDLIKQGAPAKSGIPAVNAWLNAGRRKITGDPQVAQLDNAIITLKNEYAKIMSGATGAAGVTDSARHEADVLINSAQTPQQLEAVMAQMAKEMHIRQDALRGVMEDMRQQMQGKDASDVNAPPAARRPPTAATSAPSAPSAEPSKTVDAARLRKYAAKYGVPVQQYAEFLKSHGYTVQP